MTPDPAPRRTSVPPSRPCSKSCIVICCRSIAAMTCTVTTAGIVYLHRTVSLYIDTKGSDFHACRNGGWIYRRGAATFRSPNRIATTYDKALHKRQTREAEESWSESVLCHSLSHCPRGDYPLCQYRVRQSGVGTLYPPDVREGRNHRVPITQNQNSSIQNQGCYSTK